MKYKAIFSSILLAASLVIIPGCTSNSSDSAYDQIKGVSDDSLGFDMGTEKTEEPNVYDQMVGDTAWIRSASEDLETAKAESAAPDAFPVTQLVPLSSSATCNQCRYYLLPGKRVPSQTTRYSIHSDLPEILLTPGVLYSTESILPPFNLKDGTPLSEAMRTQDNRGFKTIDDSFEVFIFHISQPGDGSQPRRVVVYAENKGDTPVSVRPRQVIITDGIIGTVHEMESNLGRRVLSEDWDMPLEAVSIAPGEGAVVAYSKQFAAPRNDADSSANVNCFGIVRADVYTDARGSRPDLDVHIVGIPGRNTPDELNTVTAGYLDKGAQSGEGYLDFNKTPQGCALSRTCGVFESFVWRSSVVTLDAANLPDNAVKFQMALPAIQAGGCEEARQTQDLLLSQPYNRPDTVGNYMVDYYLTFHLVNTGDTARRMDVRFGKSDADIGLGWQVSINKEGVEEFIVDGFPVRTAWAGPKQMADFPDDTRSFLEFDGGAIALQPGERRFVNVRFLILGNSSLPFQIGVVSEDIP